jgi:hypothetical protein
VILCHQAAATVAEADQRLGNLRNNFVSGRSAFRRRLLVGSGAYDEILRCADDSDHWIWLILGGATAGLVDEPLAITRIQGNSLTSSEVRLREGQRGALSKVLGRDDLGAQERSLVESHLETIGLLLDLAEARQAVEESREDRRRCPRMALSSGQPLSSRSKAAVAAAFHGRATRRSILHARPAIRTGLQPEAGSCRP